MLWTYPQELESPHNEIATTCCPTLHIENVQEPEGSFQTQRATPGTTEMLATAAPTDSLEPLAKLALSQLQKPIDGQFQESFTYALTRLRK